MLLFTKIELCTTNNGFTSPLFFKGRGINQGCPGSPLIYTYCGEVLNHVVQQNSGIRGVPMNSLKNILSQFADGTSAFLKYECVSVQNFAESLQCIEEQLGLKVSYEKTTLYRVGSLRDLNAILYTTKNFQWSNGPVETLGVSFNCDGSTNLDNYDSIIAKLENVKNLWMNHHLTLMGHVLVVNTLMGSLFVYKMMSVTNLSKEQYSKIKALIQDYLWKGRRPKISWYTLTRKMEQGGLRLIDIEAKYKAILISWVHRLSDNATLSMIVYDNLCPVIREKIWQCNLSKKDAMRQFTGENYWSRVLHTWCILNYCEPECADEVLDQIIWCNSYIRIEDRPVFWKQFFDKGIVYIRDIMDKDSEIIIPNGVNWWDATRLFSAILQEWRKLVREHTQGEPKTKLIEKLQNINQPTRYIYDLLIDDENHLFKYVERWGLELPEFDLFLAELL